MGLFFVFNLFLPMKGIIPFHPTIRRHAGSGARQPVGAAGGFRKAEAGAAAQDDLKAVLQADPMADRDEHRRHPLAGAQGRPDDPAAVPQVAEAAAFGAGLGIPADQAGLGAADGRQVQ